jgi:hypothetical protein
MGVDNFGKICHSTFLKLILQPVLDIDECIIGTAGCEQVCKNSPGHYNCYCYYGYTLNDDRKTCFECKYSIIAKLCNHHVIIY